MKFMYRSLVAVLFFSSILSLQSPARAATNEASGAQAPVIVPATDTNAEHHVGHFRKHMQKIAQALGLTEAQKEQLKPIIHAAITQRRAIRANASLTHEQKKEQLKALRAEVAAQMKTILTPEQLEKWKALRHHHHSQKSPTPPASTLPQ